MPCREIELCVDETLDALVVGEASTVGVQEGSLNFVPYPLHQWGQQEESRAFPKNV